MVRGDVAVNAIVIVSVVIVAAAAAAAVSSVVVVDSNYHIIDGKCHENDKDKADHHGCLIYFGPAFSFGLVFRGGHCDGGSDTDGTAVVHELV